MRKALFLACSSSCFVCPSSRCLCYCYVVVSKQYTHIVYNTVVSCVVLSHKYIFFYRRKIRRCRYICFLIYAHKNRRPLLTQNKRSLSLSLKKILRAAHCVWVVFIILHTYIFVLFMRAFEWWKKNHSRKYVYAHPTQ